MQFGISVHSVTNPLLKVGEYPGLQAIQRASSKTDFPYSVSIIIKTAPQFSSKLKECFSVYSYKSIQKLDFVAEFEDKSEFGSLLKELKKFSFIATAGTNFSLLHS